MVEPQQTLSSIQRDIWLHLHSVCFVRTLHPLHCIFRSFKLIIIFSTENYLILELVFNG
jgi:hypothetical protein